MKKLLYLGNWGKSDEYAWSGTMSGLYKGLKNSFDVERLDINAKTPALFLLRCLEKMKLGRFDTLYVKYYNRVYARKYSSRADNIIFQFEESGSYEWGKSYIFQDLNIKFLLEMYKNQPEVFRYSGLDNLSLRYLLKRSKTQSEYYQKASGIFTMGQWLADYIVEKEGLSCDKVHAVGGGINIDAGKIDYSLKESKRILFVGRDFMRKGGDLVVNAFRLLREKMPDAELYIAGPQKNPLAKEQVDGIFFVGAQGAEQLVQLYNQCDVFCMPSRFEAYGLVFAEALAFGLPCIARNAFAMKEMIQDGENGYLVDSDDIYVLADKMQRALENKKMQSDVKSQKNFYLQKYSWENVAMRISTVINQDI